jgi:hypothetical protein
MGKVIENACAFLNGSPSFLQHNRQKAIKLSTLKNKLTEWLRDVRAERDSHDMGADAFYDIGSHSDSTKLVIQIVRMQDVALQRQERERVQADPARLDPHLAQAVRIPGPVAANASAAPQSDTAHLAQAVRIPGPVVANASAAPQVDTVESRFLAAQAHYASLRASAPGSRSSNSSRGGRNRLVTIDAAHAEAVRQQSQNSQASHPGAVAPNTIQVWSGSHGSSNARKRLMAVAGGENVPTAQRPAIEGFLPNFLESANSYRSAQETKSNAVMLGAATSFIEYARNLPADDPLRQDLLTLGIQKARSILQPVEPPPQPEPALQPAIPDQQVSFEALMCSICHETFEINPLRGTYSNAIFTPCQHPYHPACLAQHRQTQLSMGDYRTVKCPTCNEVLRPDFF